VVADVAMGVAVILVAPLFAPYGSAKPWTDWPIAATFLVAVEASVCLSARHAAAATSCFRPRLIGRTAVVGSVHQK